MEVNKHGVAVFEAGQHPRAIRKENEAAETKKEVAAKEKSPRAAKKDGVVDTKNESKKDVNTTPAEGEGTSE